MHEKDWRHAEAKHLKAIPADQWAKTMAIPAKQAYLNDIDRTEKAVKFFHKRLLKSEKKTTENSFQLIIANLSGGARRVIRNGREFLVAPLSMLRTGVLAGSKGPLFYPTQEIAKNHGAWDGTPIVVYHPTRNGRDVSAQAPDILAKSGIGYVAKPVVKNGKLRGEGWFDVEHVKRIDNRIYESLVKGRPIELSTGLYTDNVPAQNGANYNGRPYVAVARNYKPDHLAILPDQIGACSIKDGCGVLINRSSGETWQPITTNRNWSQKMRDKLPDDDFAGPHQSFPIKTQRDVYAAAHSLGRAKGDSEPIKRRIIEIAKRKGLKLPDAWAAEQTQTTNDDQTDYGEQVGKAHKCTCGGTCDKCKTHNADYPWEKCMADAEKRYGSKEQADKVCGAIKAANNAAQPSGQLDMTPDKACKILKDGTVHGKELTPAQRGMFGALCGQRTKNEWTPVANSGVIQRPSWTPISKSQAN